MKNTNLDLQIAVILTSLTLIFILVPPFNKTFLRVFFSLPILFIIPGYVFVSALFPGKKGLDGVERVLFSVGLSLAVVSFTGFMLNFTEYGIALVPVISVLYVFILFFSGVSFLRRMRRPEEDRFAVNWEAWVREGKKLLSSLVKS